LKEHCWFAPGREGPGANIFEASVFWPAINILGLLSIFLSCYQYFCPLSIIWELKGIGLLFDDSLGGGNQIKQGILSKRL
jgi:hypothetical protein